MSDTPYAQETLIWIDLETTGLDPVKDQILEIACILTRADLTEIRRCSYVITPTEPITTSLFVAGMHAKNGLWEELSRTGDEQVSCDLYHVDGALAAWLGTPHGKGLIAGSTPQFDKAFLEVHMPRVHALLNHRVFDVSTLKAAMRMWYLDTWSTSSGEPAHRAMADIEGSIAVARDFRNFVLPAT